MLMSSSSTSTMQRQIRLTTRRLRAPSCFHSRQRRLHMPYLLPTGEPKVALCSRFLQENISRVLVGWKNGQRSHDRGRRTTMGSGIHFLETYLKYSLCVAEASSGRMGGAERRPRGPSREVVAITCLTLATRAKRDNIGVDREHICDRAKARTKVANTQQQRTMIMILKGPRYLGETNKTSMTV